MDRLLRASQAGRATEGYQEDQVILPEGAVIDIVRVEQLSDYKLKLYFSNGVDRIIDFEAFLQASRNPLIRAYLDARKFANFKLEYGELVWDDYGLCFPIVDLYENRI
ncbi:MAG TPA: DUF2442 domain-containing protein [Candidatus Saccharimonadales bacterium]|nr:DUF2442 domain-containing protein [Candidatus Saccharimonadales bacterium]